MAGRTATAVALAAFGLAASLHVRAQSADAQAGPTYSRDVAPIIYKNCTGCHRPGEIGPMSLLTYANTYPWAKAIAARVSAETPSARGGSTRSRAASSRPRPAAGH